MSEVELQAIYSAFDLAKTEYILLLSEINTTCLGNTLTDKCASADKLNTLMKNSLIQMSTFFESTNTENTENKEKILQIFEQLQEDRANLKVLETNDALEKDNQVIATMNYHQALLWFVACITIVLLLYNQSLMILFVVCIMIGLLLYHQLWFLGIITAGLYYFFLIKK